MAERSLESAVAITIALVLLIGGFAQAKEPLSPGGGSSEFKESAPTRIYAIIVANNTSVDSGVIPLRYADDDGARYWELFSAMTDDVHLLTTLDNESQILFEGLAAKTRAPTRARVLETLSVVSRSMAADRAANVKTSLFVVFTGHGAVADDGVGHLSLSDGPFTRKDLHQYVIAPQIADRTHLIIDACHAYYMVRSRDGKPGGDRSGSTYDDEFAQFVERSNQRGQAPTVGVFLSTAGAAEVHEWSRYRGGVFSHQIRSGLLGAADVDGDLAITYQELEAYLASANASVTNPRARVNVFARAPAQSKHEPIIELGRLRKATFLELETSRSGRYHLEDSRGVRYADFNKASDGVMRLALLWEPLWRAPYYFVRAGETEARVGPDSADASGVKFSGLSFVERPDVARGSVEEAYRSSLFATPFGRGFFEGYNAATDRDELASVTSPGAPDLDPLDAIRYGFQIGGSLSQAPFDLDGVHYSADLSADFWLSQRLALQLVGGYGTSSHSAIEGTPDASPFSLHRAMLGVGATWRWYLPASVTLDTYGRAGHQWLIYTSSRQSRGDALSLRSEAGAALGYQLVDELHLALRGGVVMDVLTVDDREDFNFFPQAGLVFGYRY